MSLEEYDNELEIVEKYFLKSDEGRQKECYYFIGDIIEQTDVRIPPKSGINVEQALALRFYCCYTNLSAKFSATFRKLPNELCEDLIKRNSEFHHWSKHLYEAIHLFGDDVINKQFGDYVYHGIDEPMIFETIVGWMYGPISTTGKKAVAFNFAANGNGLVLQLNTYHNIPNFYSFFNCRCISDFAAEDEKLFLHVQLRIESIYHMPLEQIYIEECQAIDILYNILTAQEMINIDIVSDKHIEYYESMMKQEYDKYPPYINKLFNNIISPITEISINLWLMNQDQYKYVNYGHESVKHGYKKLKPFFMNASNDFLYIDKLCKLCPNVGNIRFYNQVKAKSERKDNDLHSDHSSKCVVLNDDFLSELLLCKPTSKSLRRIVIVDPDETMMTIKQFTQRYYSKTTDYTKRFRLSGCKTLTLSANIDQYDLSDVWYYEHFDRISHILRNAQIQNGHNFEYCVGVDFGYEDMRVGICDIKTQTIYSEKQIRNWSVWDLKNRSLQTLKYILSKIIKIFPKYGISLEDITKIQWILTVPTIWSEKAKLTIMTTAYDAGLISPYIRNHIRIIDEPNCAAFDCLNNPDTIYPITEGHVYVLLSAGADNVDIICHEFSNEYYSKEVKGGTYGSQYIDEYFETFLKAVFGSDTIRKMKEKNIDIFWKIKKEFSRSKCTFYDQPNCNVHPIRVESEFIEFVTANIDESDDTDEKTDNANTFNEIIEKAEPFGWSNMLSFENNRLLISTKIWKHLFNKVIDPVIDEIKGLLDTMNKAVNHLIITGGLSKSKYYQHRINEAFGQNTKYNLLIQNLKNPILSVLNGALKLGMQPNAMCTVKRLKYMYGIKFDASNDEKTEQKYDASEEKNRAIVDEIFHMISNNNPTHNEENDILKTVTSHRSNDGRVWNNLEVEQIVSVYIGYNTFSAAFCPLGYPSHLRIVQDWSGAKAAAEHDSSDTINQNMVALLIDKETNATIAFGWKAEELYMKAQEKKETDKFMYFNQFKQHLYGKNVSDKTIQSVNGTSSISLSVLATKLFQAIAQYSLNSINGLNKLAGIDLQTTKQMYWVLTVPTSWYQSSIELIETSMKNVGMEHYETISEPVASAFHFLNCSYKKSQQTVYLLVECNEHTTNATALVIDDRLYFKVLYCDEFEALSGSIEDKFKSVLTELLPSDIITPIIENQPHQWIRQMQEFYLAKRSVPYEFEDEDAWNVPF
eukprot:430269_1